MYIHDIFIHTRPASVQNQENLIILYGPNRADGEIGLCNEIKQLE